MSCADPRHADCPNCDGEVLLKPDLSGPMTDPIQDGYVDTVTGAWEVREVQLPKHVNVPMNCHSPLVPFVDLVAKAKAGDQAALKAMKGWPAQVVQAALGSAFQVRANPGKPEMVEAIQPA